MRIFISHSWRDKTIADQLARDLGGMGDVWQDIERLKPGDEIQPTIDAALATMDLVVLLWSEHSARSAAVSEEIRTTRRLGKTLIPCMLDDTPLDESIRGTLGIPFNDYPVGFGRLCIHVLRHLDAETGLAEESELQSIQDLEGVLSYVRDYRNKTGVADGERDHWIERVLTTLNVLTARMEALRRRTGEAGDFVQTVYRRLEEAGEDRERVYEILQEVVRKEHTAPGILGQVRVHVEAYLQTLPEPPASEAPRATASAVGARATDAAADLRISAADARSRIEQHLHGFVPAEAVGATVEALEYYIGAMRDMLGALGRLASARGSPAGEQVVHLLLAYLEEPNDLLPESDHGAWGHLDDAWLIHNTAYRLVEAGLVPRDAFPVDWDRIVAGDAIATACLPATVRHELANYLTQLLGLIAAEARSYAPQFVSTGRTYQPLMGRGGAVRSDGGRLNVMYRDLENSLAQISLDGWQRSLDTDYAGSVEPDSY